MNAIGNASRFKRHCKEFMDERVKAKAKAFELRERLMSIRGNHTCVDCGSRGVWGLSYWDRGAVIIMCQLYAAHMTYSSADRLCYVLS